MSDPFAASKISQALAGHTDRLNPIKPPDDGVVWQTTYKEAFVSTATSRNWQIVDAREWAATYMFEAWLRHHNSEVSPEEYAKRDVVVCEKAFGWSSARPIIKKPMSDLSDYDLKQRYSDLDVKRKCRLIEYRLWADAAAIEAHELADELDMRGICMGGDNT
jgi:hypothetical protein